MKNQQEIRAIWNAVFEATPTQAGVAVPKPIAETIADALRTFSAVRRVATVVTTELGGELGWPNSDGRNEIGEQLDQNVQSGSQDPSFGKTAVPAYKFSSRLIRVPVELWQDAGADFSGFLEKRIATRIGRITNKKLTTGSGNGEPMGVVTAAGVGRIGTAGQFMTVTDDDLEDLLYSVDESYRLSPSCCWMMHEQTLRAIAKLKDPNGAPLQLVERGADLIQRLKGYPVVVNNDVPVMAANAKSILFGDFSTFVVRDVLSVDIRRLTDSALLMFGQFGVIGFARTGGAYVDVGGAIMAYQNAAA